MNSRTKAQQADHAEATAFCAKANCLVCGAHGCVPAHIAIVDGEVRSGHRGMGGGKSDWQWGSWVPLCATWSVHQCHDLVDRRLGVSERIEEKRQAALAKLVERAPVFWGQAA
jgi:hypothetical protein